MARERPNTRSGALGARAPPCDRRCMTNDEPHAQPAARDLSELSRMILDGERVPPKQLPPVPPRRIVPSAVRPLDGSSKVTQILLACWVPVSVVALVFGVMQRS